MRTLFVTTLFFIGFFTTPTQLVQDLLQMTTVDLPRIELTGTREGEVPKPVTLSYDPVADEVSLSVGDERSLLRGDRIAPWMRLFFRKKISDKPADQAVTFLSYLSSLGIATDKKGISVTAPEGDLVLFIGREKATETTPALFLYRDTRLPYRLVIGESDARFEDYHRSVMPLIFPGRITITEQGKTVIYRFVRNEYR